MRELAAAAYYAIMDWRIYQMSLCMLAGECLYHTARNKAAKQYKLALKLSPEVISVLCADLAPVFEHLGN